jgi:uncharacterized protein GlcG (DUF336 family)
MITLKIAEQMIEAAVEQAERLGNQCSVAIVDDNGWLIALHKMDGAAFPTVDIARDKAWTAATFKLPSSEISKFGDPSARGFGFNTQNWNSRLTTIPGGLPIKKANEVIGGIGVCGGKPEEDIVVCEAGLTGLA